MENPDKLTTYRQTKQKTQHNVLDTNTRKKPTKKVNKTYKQGEVKTVRTPFLLECGHHNT